MKTRESGMPDEDRWATYFDVEAVLDRLELPAGTGSIAEFGSGYGTFTLPAARRCAGTVFAFDIEPDLIALVDRRSREANLSNIETRLRDFAADGTGLPDASISYVMLFNILHAEERAGLLDEAHRILEPGGTLGVIHWIYDASTPRGPSLDIRPRPADCRAWTIDAGFEASPIVDLPPYHYGFTATKPRSI